MGAATSRAPPARGSGASAPACACERGPDLSLLPPELLLQVLSHVPPRALLLRCRRVCRAWRALVDGQALWLLLLARRHAALLPVVRACLPPARPAAPSLLGRFCALRPLGRNLVRNPCGQEGFRKWMVRHDGNGWVVEPNRTSIPGAPAQTCFVSSYRWCHKKQVLDLEEEGLWPELLDSGMIEICVSDWWGGRHDCGCKYRLIVQLLDGNFSILEEFSATPEPIPQWNNDACQQAEEMTQKNMPQGECGLDLRQCMNCAELRRPFLEVLKGYKMLEIKLGVPACKTPCTYSSPKVVHLLVSILH